MKSIINFSSTNLVRVGALVCILCFVLLCGCNGQDSSCEITVSGSGSLCQIQYTDNDGVMHNVIIQSDSEIINIDDCDEVLNVDCS
ncbi:MAG TPA: hypothetical protein VLZ81_03715 [Blastocatellia bacterium]|nr:hypothetical protein [Blastocatellia bacterium]